MEMGGFQIGICGVQKVKKLPLPGLGKWGTGIWMGLSSWYSGRAGTNT